MLYLLVTGTPPRVWGRVNLMNNPPSFGGDTPTCVGKSIMKRNLITNRGGHPHVCGEETVTLPSSHVPQGTPPRVWGRGRQNKQRSLQARDTPTCVGKRPAKQTAKPTSKGHPHVCGEEKWPPSQNQGLLGTPPRVWGRATTILWKTKLYRDTPTCVGKSKR